MRGLPPKFQPTKQRRAAGDGTKTKRRRCGCPRYVKPTPRSFPSCLDCWDLASGGTGRIACATGRRKFKRAGPTNSIGTRTNRRMPALQEERATANQRRRGLLLVATARSWRVGAQAEAYATERRVSGLRLLFCAVRLFRGRSFLVLFFARGSLGRGAFRGSAGGFVPFGRRPGRRELSIVRVCRRRWRLPASADPA